MGEKNSQTEYIIWKTIKMADVAKAQEEDVEDKRPQGILTGSFNLDPTKSNWI